MSKLEIMNKALGMLGANQIYNIDDDQFFVCYSQTDNNIYCI